LCDLALNDVKITRRKRICAIH